MSHFLLAIAGCLGIYFFPQAGLWPIFLPAILFAARILLDRPLLHDRWIDGLLAIFLVTACAGYWAAYDTTAAWTKLRLLIAGILLYYAISTQPASSLDILAGFWFAFGVGIAGYFLLTHDFESSPVKFHYINQIGLSWMSIRPAIAWPAIQPTDAAAGMAIITSVYGFYFLDPSHGNWQGYLKKILVLVGLGIVLSAVILATSRGALVAMAAAIGILLTWLVIQHMQSPGKEKMSKWFPFGVFLLFGLTALWLILPWGIFGTGFLIGENILLDRSELIRNGISIMKDFPFLGGGLDAFPGLFSQYILVIPYYSLPNSHNIFVDVMIEQGMLGGLAFLLIYSIGLWKTASILIRQHTNRMQILYGCAFVSIFIAMMHGLVDDYLYSGWWAALAFFPVAMSMLLAGTEPGRETRSTWYFRRVPLPGWGTSVYSRGLPVLVAGSVIIGLALAWNGIAAQWYANLGAVKMSRIELAGFPANQWDEGDRVAELESVKILFYRSLTYDPGNRLANHRLGLIKISERDFDAASRHLAIAYQKDPLHRGVIKNLGYSYAWLGEMDQASLYLEEIPEAQSELGVYVWWWNTRGRQDLSANASALVSRLSSTDRQH